VATLRAAIERARLKAQKGSDGQWRSTRVWVDEYNASKYQRKQSHPSGGGKFSLQGQVGFLTVNSSH
jgi:hypothetical protein